MLNPPVCVCVYGVILAPFFCFCPPGGSHHAGSAADPRTDRHVAPGAAAEHPHPQRADSEDCRSAVTVQLSQTGLG